MHKKLERIKEIFEEKYSDDKDAVIVLGLENDDSWHSIDVDHEVNFYVEKDILCVSFYSNCRPTSAAFYIQELYASGITDFEIYEASFVMYNEEKDEPEMFFGEEAEHKYFQCVVESYLSNLADKEEKGECKCH